VARRSLCGIALALFSVACRRFLPYFYFISFIIPYFCECSLQRIKIFHELQ
ncbi:hypothetical protein RUMCAL_02580, partial [Ruminococcus callidus ATCC 27760]